MKSILTFDISSTDPNLVFDLQIPLQTEPYGYEIVDDRLVINEEEARVVFQLYQKMGVSRIAKVLNTEGIKSMKGCNWSDAQVYYVVTNPIYADKLRYHDTIIDGDHTPIISPEEFEKTMALVEKRKRSHSAKAMTSDYIFSGSSFVPVADTH